MRNLRIRNAVQDVPNGLKEHIAGCTLFCTDINEKLYFLLPAHILVFEKKTHELVTFPLGESFSDATCASNICIFDILIDSEELCIIFGSGRVFLMQTDTGLMKECGCFEDGVAAGAWSPDMQMLVIATPSKLISVSREFETNVEVGLFPDYAGSEELQTVGWGSAETQFQGQAGKANRDKIDANVVPTENHKFDNGLTLICWRPDSQLIATSTVEYVTHRAIGKEVLGRRIRIWDRELQFLSCCEILAGIEPTLAFRPGRNHIVTTRLLDDERSLWFFEQNGQYRFNSKIKTEENSYVRKIQFDLAGVILMVLCRIRDNIDEFQFWMVSNTEWAMKSCFRPSTSVVHCFFSQEIGGLLHYVTTDGQCWSVELEPIYTCENGLAMSITGDTIRFTDLAKAALPPPMCHNALNLEENITYATISHDRYYAALTSHLRLVHGTFKISGSANSAKIKHLVNYFPNGVLYDLNWSGNQEVTAIWSSDNCWKIVAIPLSSDSGIRELYRSEKDVLFHEFVQSDDKLYLLDSDGRCSAYDNTEKSSRTLFTIESKHFHRWTRIRSKMNLFITQNATYALYCNAKLILENCRSYIITPEEDFLLVTTLSDKLIVIKIAEVLSYLVSDAQKFVNICGTREVENGSILIGHEPGPTGTMCWIQMPRGNLEQIHPRPVLIERLKALVANQEYHEAMLRMRRHRVNMNLLVDLDPSEFQKNILRFVDQFNFSNVLDAELLNIFVSSLEEDPSKKKISAVCNLLRASILKEESASSDIGNAPIYTVVLSCIVRCGVNQVVEALMDVKHRADKYMDSETKTKFLGQSLRHLCYIVPENVLFESAFRTYDLNIVSMIADKQQKDPKEYVPIINELRSKTPDSYRNFCICVRLKDWSEALKQIAQVSEKFDECAQHIIQHSLYVEALPLFRNSSHYKVICQLFAEHLFTKTKYNEAAAFFEKCGELDRALKCLELSMDYESFISVAQRHRRPTADALQKMLFQLERRENYGAVAEIYSFVDEKANASKIIEAYVKAMLWSKAADCALRHTVEYDLKAALKQRAASLIQQANEWCELLKRYSDRLTQLRLQKEKILENWIDVKDADLGNETISKKKTVIKEGSQYEDAAILTTLKGIYKSIDHSQDELADLMPPLITFDLIEEAAGLQSQYEQLIEVCETSLRRIWPFRIQPRDLPGPIAETYRCEDGIVRMPETGGMPNFISLDDEMIPPTIRKNVKWKMLLFVVE